MWGKVARLPGLDSCTLRSSYLRDFINPHCHLHVVEQEARWSSTYWLNWSAVNIFFFFAVVILPTATTHFFCRDCKTSQPLQAIKKINTCIFHFPLLSSVYLKGRGCLGQGNPPLYLRETPVQMQTVVLLAPTNRGRGS